MAAGNPTFFVDDSAVTGRSGETSSASWDTGMNFGASNAPVVGANVDGGEVVGEPQQFTLLDQDGEARTPQASQLLGGDGYVNRSSVDWPSSGGAEGKGVDSTRSGTNPDNVNGQPDNNAPITPVENIWLDSLSSGWTEGDPTP